MLSDFALEVLGCVAHDYEAIQTIRGDLERDLDQTISENDLFAALANLVRAGLVDAFEYNPTAQAYEKISPSALTQGKEFWFLANQSGLAQL